ncbi:PD-(D/E)XK nuclease family protein [Sporolactobacillus nakayamae]|nr:PD-(D/E)XK nuclease family protein [Sporolactobacillus nakayamae]
MIDLENNQEFQRLHQKRSKFNAFKVLKVDKFEIRHSNVLAWLMDPNANHTMSDYFLQKILTSIFLNIEPDHDSKEKHLNQLFQRKDSFLDAKVFREVRIDNGRFIDLLAVSEKAKLVVLIENKYYSSESENQLKDYLAFVKSKFDETYCIIPIYLTLSGSTPSNSHYYSMSYNDVRMILESHLNLFGSRLPADVFHFINDYLAILQDELHTDQNDYELAHLIYRENQEIIQLAFEQGQSADLRLTDWNFTPNPLRDFYDKYADTIEFVHNVGQNILGEAFKVFTRKIHLDQLFNPHFRLPSFIPSKWHKKIDQLGVPLSNYWLGKGLVCWFEENTDGRLKITTELGPIDPDTRIKFLTDLKKRQVTIRESAMEPSRKFSKLYTDLTDINNWFDKNELVAGMTELYESAAFQSLVATVQNVLEHKPIIELQQMKQSVIDISENHFSNEELFGQAFKKFCETENINRDSYRITGKHTSFLLPLFNEVEEVFGETREKWWWHNGPFLYWFELNDQELLLVLELGPIEATKRIELIEHLEEQGQKVRVSAKKQEAKYTRLYSKHTTINQWGNTDEVSHAMVDLFNTSQNKEVLERIKGLTGETHKR